jgi:hypothetical protein
MANRGKRKYSCRDCNNMQFVHWTELNRRAPVRCIACGGLVEPSSEAAVEDRDRGEVHIREHDPDRGDLVRSIGYSRHHKPEK